MQQQNTEPVTDKTETIDRGDDSGVKTTTKPQPSGVTDWKTPIRPLTRKQAAFVKHLIENPKASATAAVRATYGKPDKPVTELSARNIASDNLTKPNILLELSKHSQTAELTLVEVMAYSKDYGKQGDKAGSQYASVAVQTANSILDRIHGKATQKTEVEQRSVNINIDLSGVAG